ncbi:MAG: sporulation integral membrane protein YtvI [Oscillospiraceae bacterium]|nr:sporulation integral membrane protein YtvI [Oscillospiraceae bacterium]
MSNDFKKQFLLHTLFWGTAALLIYVGVKYLILWLLPFLFGISFAVMLQPACLRLSRKTGLPKSLCSGGLIVGIYIILGVFLLLVGTELSQSLTGWIEALPTLYEEYLLPLIQRFSDFFARMGDRFAARELTFLPDPQMVTETLQGILTTLSQQLTAALAEGASHLPAIAITVAFSVASSVFVCIDYDRTVAFLRRQLTPKQRTLLRNIRHFLTDTLWKLFRAYSILFGVTFLELTVGFFILGVPNAGTVAFLVAGADLLPVVGTGTILIPWAILSLLGGNYWQAVGLLILFGVVYLVRTFLEPKLVGTQTGVPAAAMLIAIYAGWRIFGLPGMILFPLTLILLRSLHRAGIVKLWK